MTSRLPAREVISFIAAILLTAIALHTTASLLDYAGIIEYPYAFIGISRLDIPFGDLVQLTYTAGCESPISALADGSETCDPSGRPFNLMFPALYLFKLLQIDQSRHFATGGAIAIASLASLVYLATELKDEVKAISKVAFLGITLASYPMQLALERGNTDLVIITTLIIFAISLHHYLNSDSLPWLYSAGITAALSILFKLWAGPGMLAILSLESLKTLRKQDFSKRFRFLAFITTFLTALFVATYLGSEHVFKHTEVWEGHVSFGINASYYHPSIADPGLMKGPIRVWKLLVFSGSAAWWISHGASTKGTTEEESLSLSSLTLQLGFLTYLMVYLLSQSWDYRLICLALTLPALLRMQDSRCRSSSVPIFLVSFVLLELYIPVNWAFGSAETLSDFVVQPALIGILLIEVVNPYRVSLNSR